MKIRVITVNHSGTTNIDKWIESGWKPHFPAMPVIDSIGYITYHLTLTKE